MKIDSYGLPVQRDDDGGDSLQRVAFYDVGTGAALLTPAAVRHCQPKKGLWVRHPKPGVFWSDPRTTTGDQLVLLPYALKQAGEWKALFWTLVRIVLRLGFSQNTRSSDGSLRVPDCLWFRFSPIIRAIPYCPAPLIWMCDILFMIGTLLEGAMPRWKHEDFKFVPKTQDDVDVNNLVASLKIMVEHRPNSIVFATIWIARRFMHDNYGNTRLGEDNRFYGALRWYHREEAKGNPEMASLYARFCRVWLPDYP